MKALHVLYTYIQTSVVRKAAGAIQEYPLFETVSKY